MFSLALRVTQGAVVCLVLVSAVSGCGNAEKRLVRVLLDTKLECQLDEKCFKDEEYDCKDPFFTEGDISQAIDELDLSKTEVNACRKAHKAADKCQLKSSCHEYFEERDYCSWGHDLIACCEIEGWQNGEDLCAEDHGGRCASERATWLKDCGKLVQRVDSIAYERVFGWRRDLPPEMRLTPQASCLIEEAGLGMCTSFAGDLSVDMTVEEAWCSTEGGAFARGEGCANEDLGECVLPPLKGDTEGASQVVKHYFSVNESEVTREATIEAFEDCVVRGDFLPPPGVP